MSQFAPSTLSVDIYRKQFVTQGEYITQGEHTIAFNPANTKWSVAAFDDNGKLDGFHPTPWEFHDQLIKAGNLWYGGYTPIPGSNNGFLCEIAIAGGYDSFKVFFVTPTRFIATKNDAIYRFGKKI